MTNGVYIALSAFGPDRVRTLGQPAFFAIAAAAGAEGVEVRRELFADAVPPLSAMAAFGRDLGLRRRYSVPFELHGADGTLQADELARYAAEAEALGADVLKVSLGHAPEVPDRAALASLVAGLPCRLLIENDQTPQGGRLAPLAAFLEATADLAIGLTFDVGNWSWTGEDAVDASPGWRHRLPMSIARARRPRPASWWPDRWRPPRRWPPPCSRPCRLACHAPSNSP